MGITRAHVLYAVNVDPTTEEAMLAGITEFNVDTAIEELLLQGDGAIDPTFVAVQQQAPKIGFSSSSIAAALALSGLNALAIDLGLGDDGLECWFQKVSEGGVRATGSNHLKMTIAQGMLVPRRVTAEIDGAAEISYECIATYDGTNAPIVIADSAALEGSPLAAEAFVAGKVSINGVTLEGVQRIQVDFGISELLLSGDGEVWPTFVAIQQRRPSITIRTTDVVSLDTFGLSGAAQGATDSIVYLRKVAKDGTRVADGTAEHVSFTMDDGRIKVNSAEARGANNAESEIVLMPTYDGTNPIIAVSTATTIV